MTAIQEFNDAFGVAVLDPVAVEEQPALTLIANRKGRTDIAQRLREHFDAQRVAQIREREFLSK